MSAILCGKRSHFEELPDFSTTPVAKKIRCSSSSPVRFSSFSPPSRSLLDKLREAFPLMDHQVLEKTLEECGDDIDAAIKCLHELCIGTSGETLGSLNHVDALPKQGSLSAEEQPVPTADCSTENSLPTDGSQWVELFVKEMMSASSVDDARARAARVLEILEKSIKDRAAAEVSENYQKENNMLKEQIQALVNDNNILKRGIQIQHERQKEYEDIIQEGQHVKQLLSQYQEQLRRLEVTNYTLTMHLKQAQQTNSIPGRYNPDVF